MRFGVFEEASAEISVLKSRFIGLLFPLKNRDEISKKLKECREKYSDARHITYASRFEGEEKASDDGEPSKTVGMPLLSLLRGKNLDQVLLVVVRYFGGTKLGAGRLMHTYLEAGKLTLQKAKIGQFVEGLSLSYQIPYSSYDSVQHIATKLGLTLEEVSFDVCNVSFLAQKETKMALRFKQMLLSLGYSPMKESSIITLEESYDQ